MENDRSKIDYILSMPTIVFIIIQVIFIIFLVFSLTKLHQPNKITDDDLSRIPVAKISNFSSMAPKDYSGSANLIETTLFQLVLRNSPDQDVAKSFNALIREDSAKTVFFEKQNVGYFSAIIDIPELRQSYWFYNEYSSDQPSRYIDYSKSYRIFCLDESQEAIYPEFICRDDFGLDGRYELVSDLIPYFQFQDFVSIYSYKKGFNEIEISPYSFNELSYDTQELYIQQVKDAVASLGVTPSIFTYSVLLPEDVRYYYSLRQSL